MIDFFFYAQLMFRVGSELVYHRLPWNEPEAPYLLEILYEDDDMVNLLKLIAWLSLYISFLGL